MVLAQETFSFINSSKLIGPFVNLSICEIELALKCT